MWGYVSQPYKTGKIITLHILIFNMITVTNLFFYFHHEPHSYVVVSFPDTFLNILYKKKQQG